MQAAMVVRTNRGGKWQKTESLDESWAYHSIFVCSDEVRPTKPSLLFFGQKRIPESHRIPMPSINPI